MTDESRKLNAIYDAVMKLTDVQLSRKELAAKWRVDETTIDNYRKYHGLPILKNKKYAYGAVTDWLYGSPISKTGQGERILRIIEETPVKKK